MRIAIYYDNRYGRNDGPPLYYFNVMKNQLKLDCVHLIPEGDTRREGKFDYHFWVDWGEDALGLTEWKIPDDGGEKIYVVSDAHLDNGYRFKKAQEFDYVFFNQKHYLDQYHDVIAHDPMHQSTHIIQSNGEVQKHYYLPHAAEPQAYPHVETIKKYDLCFVGHIQEEHKGNSINVSRVEALDYMFKEFPNFYFGTRNPQWPEKHMFEHAAARFNESRIVFNISIGNDLNMRFFEVLSTGSFLLTNKIPELESIADRGLDDGVHYVSYTSLEDAKEKAKYYLEHEEERQKIARAGHEAFTGGHTYRHRVEEILKIVG